MEGNIVVDGILASCYPSTHHDLAHISMAPINSFPDIIMWLLGEENGFSGFVKLLKTLADMLYLMDIIMNKTGCYILW